MEKIILTALSKDKDRRYASADALESDLKKYLHGEPISARPPTTTYILRKKFRKYWIRSLVGLSIIMALLALGVYHLQQMKAEQNRTKAALEKSEANIRLLRKVWGLLASGKADSQNANTTDIVLNDAKKQLLDEINDWSNEEPDEANILAQYARSLYIEALIAILEKNGERADRQFGRAIESTRAAYGEESTSYFRLLSRRAAFLDGMLDKRTVAGYWRELAEEAEKLMDRKESDPVYSLYYYRGTFEADNLIESGGVKDVERTQVIRNHVLTFVEFCRQLPPTLWDHEEFTETAIAVVSLFDHAFIDFEMVCNLLWQTLYMATSPQAMDNREFNPQINTAALHFMMGITLQQHGMYEAAEYPMAQASCIFDSIAEHTENKQAIESLRFLLNYFSRVYPLEASGKHSLGLAEWERIADEINRFEGDGMLREVNAYVMERIAEIYDREGEPQKERNTRERGREGLAADYVQDSDNESNFIDYALSLSSLIGDDNNLHQDELEKIVDGYLGSASITLAGQHLSAFLLERLASSLVLSGQTNEGDILLHRSQNMATGVLAKLENEEYQTAVVAAQYLDLGVQAEVFTAWRDPAVFFYETMSRIVDPLLHNDPTNSVYADLADAAIRRRVDLLNRLGRTNEAAEIHAQIDRTLVIHYHRPKGDYDDWNLWIWPEGRVGAAYLFKEEDDFGKVARIPLRSRLNRAGFIIRKAEWVGRDLETDRFVDFGTNRVVEVWIEEGKVEIQFLPPAT